MGQPKTFKGLQKENVGREEAIEGSDEIDFNSFDSFFSEFLSIDHQRIVEIERLLKIT